MASTLVLLLPALAYIQTPPTIHYLPSPTRIPTICNIQSQVFFCSFFYLRGLGMNLLGMWSDSRTVVSSDPLAQRKRAWLGVLAPGQTPPLASRTAMSRFLLSIASCWSCLYVFRSLPLSGTHGGIPFCSLCRQAVAAAPSLTDKYPFQFINQKKKTS